MTGDTIPTRTYDLHRFELSDMIRLGASLRQLNADATTMEDAASTIVRFLYGQFVHPETHEPNCVLVRFFKTHRFEDLEASLQGFARSAARNSEKLSADTVCLTLLATAGDRPEWNDRTRSSGHKAIPLLTEEMVLQAPMVAQLIQQMGLSISEVLRPDTAIMLDTEQRSYNVFHVPDAPGSPFVPSQDFVLANGVKSVLGFGGLLPTGELFSVIIFSRVYVPRETAEMFRTLALGIKLTLLPYVGGQIFAKAV